MSSLWNRRDAESVVNHVTLRDALNWAMPARSFGACRVGVNTSWKARMLVGAGTGFLDLWCC